jgi:hypothetical protein
MNLSNLFGVREFHYRYNQPIVVRYIFSDLDTLRDLDEKFFADLSGSDLASADLNTLKDYEQVIRFRDTMIFDPAIKASLRKIHEGISELIAYRLLAGEDKHVLREDTLGNLFEQGDIT